MTVQCVEAGLLLAAPVLGQVQPLVSSAQLGVSSDLRQGTEEREWPVIVSGRCYLIWSGNPLTRLLCGPDTHRDMRT